MSSRRCRRKLSLWFWRAAKSGATAGLIIAVLLIPGGTTTKTPAQFAIAQNSFSISEWEINNFFSKWLYRLYLSLPYTDGSDDKRRESLNRYLELTDEANSLRLSLRIAATSGDKTRADQIDEQIAEIDRLQRQYQKLTEEYLESELSAVLHEAGFGGAGDLLWPPVDIALVNGVRAIAVSERTSISLKESLLVSPDITLKEAEDAEKTLEEEWDLSGVVLDVGGVATYPTQVINRSDLRVMLETAAHEWLHAYLIFRPLGWAYFSSPQMVEINETLAQFFGIELGRTTYNRISGEAINTLEPPVEPVADSAALENENEFRFIDFMRATRTEAEVLLDQGKVAEAESYMEERRLLLLETHGIAIRKINQAYFAFVGNYPFSGGSVSPVPREIWSVREKTGSIRGAVKALEDVGSVEEYLRRLDEIGVKSER